MTPEEAMPSVHIILNFSKTARCAFNALIGALDNHVSDRRLTISGARNRQELERQLKLVDRQSRTVVLWSFYSPAFNKARKQLQRFKTEIDHTTILHLAGGVHASAEPLATLQAGFDYVAVGEGEQIIVDFIRALLDDESLHRVQGLAWLEGEQCRRNGRGALIDLDDYPPYSPRYRLFGALEITRGCIYACKFCQTPYVSKARFRHRSIENIVHHIGSMRKQGFRDYRFITPTSFSYGSVDELVNLDALANMLGAVRQTVGREARIFYGTFPSEIRPEHVSREALRILKRYVDNDNLIIGGQSGSQNVLDTSKRGHSVESVTEAVGLCVEEGFLPNVDFLFGLPGETEEDVKQTIQLAETLTGLGARIHNHTFLPLPGTPFKHSDAGQIDKTAQKHIVAMESKGQAYGKWKTQIEIAQELVQIREEHN